MPISSGSSTFNFQEISEDLIRNNILKIGNSSKEISSIWEAQLEMKSSQIKKISEDYLNSKKGASKRVLDTLPL